MLAAERYPGAMTVDQYIAQMRENRDRFIENIDATRISPTDRARFGAAPLKVLVLTEDWCGDSAQFVPVVARLERELPTVELRVLRRDLNRDLNEQFPRKDGYLAIPVFILLDENLNVIGSLVERPARASDEMAAETRRFQKDHPDLPGVTRSFDRMPDETRAEIKANMARWRVDQQERFARYMLDELAETIARARSERAA
ncbi:MAG TPA: thioredoxin family protein [Thermomicrobiaceae bacterium]|nr:thioredoxin family protein [Thermomicrobiaceae bacterium]